MKWPFILTFLFLLPGCGTFSLKDARKADREIVFNYEGRHYQKGEVNPLTPNLSVFRLYKASRKNLAKSCDCCCQ